MKFELDSSNSLYTIRGYSSAGIYVNEEVLVNSFIILPDRLIRDWPPQTVKDITDEDIVRITRLTPEVVILGTGARQQFPDFALLAPLAAAQIGIEIMDTGAACRSFMILSAEGRNVAAALLPLK